MYNIFLADDTKTVRLVLANTLMKAGYKVDLFENGKILLDQLQVTQPDLIITDIHMPVMDGFELVNSIRSNTNLDHIPIIMMTQAYIELKNKIRGFDAGANDYIIPPIDNEELLAKVRTNIKIKKLYDQISEKKNELEETVKKLEKAISEIKTLSGLIPICASCKKIRDDSGYWTNVEKYMTEHSNADFSHGICPNCMEELYPKTYARLKEKGKI